MTIAIDFETFYTDDYSIDKYGPEGYCAHELFEPYWISAFDGETGFSYSGLPQSFPWERINESDVVSHNARFDETVFRAMQSRGWAPINVKPKSWRCTADLAVYLDAPRSLKGAAKAFFGVEVDKSVRDKMKGFNLERIKAKPGMLEEVAKYALRDSELCWKLWNEKAHLWPEKEQRVSQLNRDWGRRGVAIDVPLLEEYRGKLMEVRFAAEKNIPWEWDPDKTPLSKSPLAAECRKAGIPCPGSLAQDDEACMKWEDTYGEQYPWVGAMRNWRRSNILLKKIETLRRRLRKDGTFPYSLKYWGAHTGRFSGDSGFNMQNLPRGEVFGVDIRKLFIPRPGKKLLIADLSQIEARLLLWIVGDTKTLDAIRMGLHVYEAHAVTSMSYDKSRGPLKTTDPELYRLAKARVLGGGYGCGGAKFVVVAKKMAGLDLTLAQSKQAVADYRAANPRITNFWKKLNRDLLWSRGSDYTIELPSGRNLTFYNIRTGTDACADLEIGGTRPVKLFGGKLTENVIQAIARDVFVDNMLKLDELGFQNLFHVHDEYVLEVEPEVNKEFVRQTITTQPEWLKGCPLDAELVVTDRYTK